LKILLVDDHSLIREGLRHVLRQLDDEVVVVEAQNCREGLACVARETDLDLILLDLNLPDGSGLDALREIRTLRPEVPVVMLSASEQHGHVLEAIDQGAAGFVCKASASRVLIGALKLVLAGGIYLPPEILTRHGLTVAYQGLPSATAPAAPLTSATHKTRAALNNCDNPAETPAELGITGRQAEVLALMIQGKSNKEISRELGVAEGTIKIHVSTILKSLNVNGRIEAAAKVAQMGWTLA